MGPREDLRGAVRRTGGEGGDRRSHLGNGRRPAPGRTRDRQEGRRGGGGVLDGRRARGPRAGRRGDLPAAVPGPGPDAGARSEAGGRVPTSVTAAPARSPSRPPGGCRTMLRIAIPNKGTLSTPASQM